MVAGLPCIHDSPLGKRVGHAAGTSNHVYFSWFRQRLDLKEPIWILENVPQAGDDEARCHLGHLYMIDRIVLSPSMLGWRTRRQRQFLVGLAN